MYPKMKVRSQEQDVRYRGMSDPALPGLKALDSLFLGDFSSSGEESKPTSKKLEAELPSPHNLGTFTPLSASKVKSDGGGEEDIRPHIRASSIPRPRAVLSSPDNDDMIGSKSRRIVDRTSTLKPHQVGPKCKVNPKHSASGRPKSGREASDEVPSKSDADKAHQLGQKPKVTPKRATAERPKKEASEETATKSNIKGNKGPAMSTRVRE